MSNKTKIIYKKGDVTKVKHNNTYILIHCCNNKGVYNAGVARCIRNKWYGAYKTYMDFIEKNKGTDILGKVQLWNNPKNLNMYIGNCIAQDGYGRVKKQYVKYDALRSCLKKIKRGALYLKCDIIAPKLGSGLAGGDWNIIEKIILFLRIAL